MNNTKKIKIELEVPSFPHVVRIEPASTCNLRCRHCPTGTSKKKYGLMSEDTFDCVLASLRPLREAIKVVVLYHGGEPFLNPHFASMVSKIKDLGISFHSSTECEGIHCRMWSILWQWVDDMGPIKCCT